jgi:sugar-phosphatase
MSVVIPASAVLLDMDGTLVDSSAVVERIWGDWAVSHGLVPAEVYPVVHGRQGWQSMAILLPERDVEINRRENGELLARETVEVEGIVEIAGAGVLLAALAGHPHALVTSASHALASARMTAAGLRMPEAAVTAESVTASKPHPEGFLAGAALLGVAPADCVAFEDSHAGVAAAKAAGMRVVGVGADAAGHGADWTVADLAGVRVVAGESGLSIELAEVL